MEGDKFNATAIIAGVGGIVVLVIILSIVIYTLDNADLLKAKSTTVVSNETGIMNSSAGVYTLATFNTANRDYYIIDVHNNVTGVLIPSSNYTFNPSTGAFTNATPDVQDVNITYGYYPQTTYENASDSMSRAGLNEGINNVAIKLPTILLLIGVILLLIVLGALVIRARQIQLTELGGSVGGAGTSVSGEGPAGSL